MLKHEEDGDRERQFICPCGKGYFSYAALFTHVKQKHNGKPPGQIIKPKPQNKRGRPRKKVPATSMPQSRPPGTQGHGLTKDMLISPFNSNLQLIQTPFSLKCTPGSKFKQYQADQTHLPTTHELPSQLYETELLQDLSRNLQLKDLTPVPQEVLARVPASGVLQGEGGGCVGECIRSFLEFCKEGVRAATHSQLALMMAMLLQHIIEEERLEMGQLQIGCIHRHILTFFQYVGRKARQMDLDNYDIFSSLSTIRSLIVFFNWLNRFEVAQLGQDCRSQESLQQQLVQSQGEQYQQECQQGLQEGCFQGGHQSL